PADRPRIVQVEGSALASLGFECIADADDILKELFLGILCENARRLVAKPIADPRGQVVVEAVQERNSRHDERTVIGDAIDAETRFDAEFRRYVDGILYEGSDGCPCFAPI